MRRVLLSLVALLVLLPSAAASSGPASAQSSLQLCSLTLGPAELPPELQPEPTDPADPTVCQRVFRAERPGPSGLSLVRSMVIMTPSARQAAADFAEYRALLLGSGWEEVEPQPLGEAGTVFVGNDFQARIFSVQQLFRRGNVVVVIEASGPVLQERPEIVLELARIVDGRLARALGSSFANPVRVGSVWPVVSTPTIVRDANLSPTPLVGDMLQLGGFAGLASLDAEGTRFVAVTDRGPISELDTSNGRIMVLPLPAYTPSIVELRLQDGRLEVAGRLGLRLPGGFSDSRTGMPFVTGLPNSDADSAAFDRTGRSRWGTDPHGLDPGGIAVDPRDGSYWVCEEYGPSILHVDADGTILLRLMPGGSGLPGEYARASLPAELSRRKPNRGFEGIAISPDGGRLFAILQSPLANPDRTTGEASRNVRLLTLDLTGPEPRVDGMYVYRTEPYDQVFLADQDDVMIGDLAAVSASRLLVAERDSLDGGGYKMVYRVDLDSATNLLGWSFVSGTLEQADEDTLNALGIRPLAKTALVSLAALDWRLADLKGLALVDDSTIAVVNDNNFGFGGFDANGHALPNGVPTRLTLVHLPGSLR